MKYNKIISFLKSEYKKLYKNKNAAMKTVLNDIKSGKYILSDIEKYSINVILTFHYSEEFKNKLKENEKYELIIKKAIYMQMAINALKVVIK